MHWLSNKGRHWKIFWMTRKSDFNNPSFRSFLNYTYFLSPIINSNLCAFCHYSILKLLNQRKLEAFKEKWWNKNPNKKNCEEYEEDSGGGISIYNIGKYLLYCYNLSNLINSIIKSKIWLNTFFWGYDLNLDLFVYRWRLYCNICWYRIGNCDAGVWVCVLQGQKTS